MCVCVYYQLESHSKPAKKAALKQFAVNHLRSDAERQLQKLLPTLEEHFPPTFLEQLDRERQGETERDTDAVVAAALAAESTPAEIAKQKDTEPAEEVLEEEEQLVDEGGSDDSSPPHRRQRRRQRGPKKAAPAESSPAVSPSLRRSARKAARPETLSAATVAAAGLPSRVIGLNELRDASGLEPTEFLQVWHQQHPEVRSWLDMVEGDDDDDDDDATQPQPLGDDESKPETDESQQEAVADGTNRPQKLKDLNLKGDSARLNSLGGDDPLAASLAAGPKAPFGFVAPPSRRTRGSAAATTGAASKTAGRGRFDRSPLFNKPSANAVKHKWDEDEDEIEDDEADDENDAKDPFEYDADQSAAARLDSPRSGKLAPLDNRQPQQLSTRGRRGGVPASATSSSSSSKKRALPSPSRKAPQSSGGGKGGGSRKKYRRWTEEETENLRQGVERWGTKWALILQSYDFDERTGVDLKDRWRNLCKNA